MSLPWIRLLVVSLCVLLPAEVLAVDFAVMPVEGVNLSEGECDAIGVLFANALANEARAAVASPVHTKPLRAGGQSSAAAARQLGATRYVELRAVQLGQRVDVSGVLYGQDGGMLYRAETSAFGLDTMDAAVATLARALALRQPIPAGPAAPLAAGAGPYGLPPPPERSPEVVPAQGAYGPKVGIAAPRASGKSFSPAILIEFDGRFGPRNYFLEFGAGLMLPTDDQYGGSDSIRVTSGFLEIGGSYYLWSGNMAAYLGAGLTPAIWELKLNYDSHTTATCGAYGQVGITFTRDSRFKVFAEFRLTQLLLAVAHPINTDRYTDTVLSDTYRPMVLAFQGGVAW
jgi:hypothetical protein